MAQMSNQMSCFPFRWRTPPWTPRAALSWPRMPSLRHSSPARRTRRRGRWGRGRTWGPPMRCYWGTMRSWLPCMRGRPQSMRASLANMEAWKVPTRAWNHSTETWRTGGVSTGAVMCLQHTLAQLALITHLTTHCQIHMHDSLSMHSVPHYHYTVLKSETHTVEVRSLHTP